MAKRQFPLVLAIACYAAALLFLYLSLMAKTEGQFTYAVGDAYTQMSMAENVSSHHVWGILTNAFNGNSSSILWTQLLSIFYATLGFTVWAPLIANILFALVAILLANLILIKLNCNGWYRFFILLLFVFATPLPGLTIAGTEQTLQLCLVLLFYFYTMQTFEKDSSWAVFGLLTIALLLGAVRCEGVVLPLSVAALLLHQRKYLLSTALTGLVLLPTVLLGLYSVTQKGQFFSGALDKSNFIHLLIGDFAYLSSFVQNSDLLLPFLIAVLALLYYILRANEYPYTESLQLGLLLLSAGVIIHLLFFSLGGFFRHEAYLIGFGVLVLSKAVFEFMKLSHKSFLTDLALLFFIGLLLFPLTVRALTSLRMTPQASKSIFDNTHNIHKIN